MKKVLTLLKLEQNEISYKDEDNIFRDACIDGKMHRLFIEGWFLTQETGLFSERNSKVAGHLADLITKMVKYLDKGIRILQINNGLELPRLKNWLVHQKTVAYRPKQNEAVERENRTVIEGAKPLLYAINLPIKLWTDAVNTIINVLNRIGTNNVKGMSVCKLRIWRIWKYLVKKFYSYSEKEK